MPQEPKRRHSKGRKGKRRASISLSLPAITACTQCGSTISPHTACKSCGYYKGKKVV